MGRGDVRGDGEDSRRILGSEYLWILKAHLDEEDDGALADTRKVG